MQFQNRQDKILIIDFGSQVTKLIARRVRDLGVYSEIITPEEVKKINDYSLIKGIILSGGPSTVTKKKFQNIPKNIFKKNSNTWYMLWITTYFKIKRRKDKIIKKKKRIWKSFFNQKK